MREAEGFHKVEPSNTAIGEISSELQSTVFGQEKAMESLSRAIVRSRAGFSDPRRPEMVAMFAGPTGVGKTESAKALAKFLYPKDWETRLLRIDCSNLSENHCVSSLKGSEPGYIGYGDSNILITPEFLEKGGVIILDEFEKAAPKVKKWFLPVFEEGQQKALVPKAEGRGWSSEQATLDFANTHIILTANCGAEALHKARTGKGIGFRDHDEKVDMEKIGISEVRKSFADMPELLGRLDSIIVFNELERPEFKRIFNKFLDEINQDQRYGHNFLAVTDELREFVLDHAETGEYGAREIRHKLNTYVVDKAAEIKYSGVLPDMSALIGDLEGDEVIFWTSKVEEKPQEEFTDKEVDWIISGGPTEIDEDLPIQSQRPEVSPMKLLRDKRDAGSYIGNQEDEEIKKKKKPKPLSFMIPAEGVIFDSMDLAITIRAGGHEYQQLLEGLPIVKV